LFDTSFPMYIDFVNLAKRMECSEW